MCAEEFSAEKIKLRDIESRILAKRVELSEFETEYREVCDVFLNGSDCYPFFSTLIHERMPHYCEMNRS